MLLYSIKKQGKKMNKIVLSGWAVIAMSSLGFAGGDFKDVEPAIVPVVPIVEEDKSGLYAGLAIAYNLTYSAEKKWWDDTTPTQDEIGKLVGQLGYNFNEYIAIEGRIGTSIVDENYADVMTYSLFLKPQYPISEDFTIYGLLGFGLVQVDGSSGDNKPAAWPDVIGEEILDDTSFQWGIGLSYSINEDFSIFIDYTKLADDADINSTLYSYDPVVYDKLSSQDLTVGVTYNF